MSANHGHDSHGDSHGHDSHESSSHSSEGGGKSVIEGVMGIIQGAVSWLLPF